MNKLNVLGFDDDFPFVDYVKSMFSSFDHIDIFQEKEIIEKAQNVYKDAKRLKIKEETMEKLIYMAVYSLMGGYSLVIDIKPLSANELTTLLNYFCFNKHVREKIKMGLWASDFFSVIKSLIPSIEDLEKAIKYNQSFRVLEIYSRIIKILNADGLNPNMSKSSLEAELKKIYPIKANIFSYNSNLKNPKVFGHSKDDLTCYVRQNTYGVISSILLRYFYNKMKEYFNDTGYFFRIVDDNFSLYVLNQKVFLTYKYDDSIDLRVRNSHSSFGMKDYEFWAMALNMSEYRQREELYTECDFSRIINVNDIIVCPEDFLEETFIYYVMNEIGGDLTSVHTFLTELGIDYTIDYKKVLRLKNGVFIKRLGNIDGLSVKNIRDYPTLEKLVNKHDNERSEYIKRISAKLKADINNFAPKNDEDEDDFYTRRKKSRGRKDYID